MESKKNLVEKYRKLLGGAKTNFSGFSQWDSITSRNLSGENIGADEGIKARKVPMNTQLATPDRIRTDMPDDYLTKPADGRLSDPSDTTYFVNLPGGKGQYSTDIKDRKSLIQSIRKDDYRARKDLRGGLPGFGFQVDHIVPISLGGSDNKENKQILNNTDHEQKTKVGAIARELYYNETMDREEAINMAVHWKDKRVKGIELNDKGDLIDPTIASKKRDEWLKPASLFSYLFESVKETLSKTAHKVDDAIENVASKLTPENYFGDFADGLISGATFGYITPDSREYENENEERKAGWANLAGSLPGDLVSFVALEAALIGMAPATLGTSAAVGVGAATAKIANTYKKLRKVSSKVVPIIKKSDSVKAFSKGILTNPRFFWHRFMQNAVTGGVHSQIRNYTDEEGNLDNRLKNLKNEVVLYGAVPSLFKLSSKATKPKTVKEVISRMGATGKRATGLFTGTFATSVILGNDPLQATQDAAFITAFHGLESKLSVKSVERENTRVAQGFRRKIEPKVKAGMPDDTLDPKTLKDRLEKENKDIKEKLLKESSSPEEAMVEYEKVVLAGRQLYKGGMGENTSLKADLADMFSIIKRNEQLTPARINNTTQQIQDGIEALRKVRTGKSPKVSKSDTNSPIVNRLSQATGNSDKVNHKTAQSIRDFLQKGGGKEGNKIVIVARSDMERFMKGKNLIRSAKKSSGNPKNNLAVIGEADGKKYDLGWVPAKNNLERQVASVKTKFDGSGQTPNLDPTFDKDALAEYMENNGLEYLIATVEKGDVKATTSKQPWLTWKITPQNLAESRGIKNRLKKEAVNGKAKGDTVKGEAKDNTVDVNDPGPVNKINVNYFDKFKPSEKETDTIALELLTETGRIYKKDIDKFIAHLQGFAENPLTDKVIKKIKNQISEHGYSVRDLKDTLQSLSDHSLLSSTGINYFKNIDDFYHKLPAIEQDLLDESYFRVGKNRSGEIDQEINIEKEPAKKVTFITKKNKIIDLTRENGDKFDKEIIIKRTKRLNDNAFEVIVVDDKNKNKERKYIVDRHGKAIRKGQSYSLENFYINPEDAVEAATISADKIARNADTVPADTVPADIVPADTVPADIVPADIVPADIVPADTVPADTNKPNLTSNAKDPKIVYGKTNLKREDATHVNAKFDRETNTITVDKKAIKKTFKDKPWTKPKVDGVTPLPENSFKTKEEWVNFHVEHELAHTRSEKMDGESYSDYENRMNNDALDTMGKEKPNDPEVVDKTSVKKIKSEKKAKEEIVVEVPVKEEIVVVNDPGPVNKVKTTPTDKTDPGPAGKVETTPNVTEEEIIKIGVSHNLFKKETDVLRKAKITKIVENGSKPHSYTDKDIVAIMTDGNSPAFNKGEVDNAIKADANIVLTADIKSRERPHNVGQKKVSEYLKKNGYFELHEDNEFVPMKNLSERQKYELWKRGDIKDKDLDSEEAMDRKRTAPRTIVTLDQESFSPKEKKRIFDAINKNATIDLNTTAAERAKLKDPAQRDIVKKLKKRGYVEESPGYFVYPVEKSDKYPSINNETLKSYEIKELKKRGYVEETPGYFVHPDNVDINNISISKKYRKLNNKIILENFKKNPIGKRVRRTEPTEHTTTRQKEDIGRQVEVEGKRAVRGALSRTSELSDFKRAVEGELTSIKNKVLKENDSLFKKSKRKGYREEDVIKEITDNFNESKKISKKEYDEKIKNAKNKEEIDKIDSEYKNPLFPHNYKSFYDYATEMVNKGEEIILHNQDGDRFKNINLRDHNKEIHESYKEYIRDNIKEFVNKKRRKIAIIGTAGRDKNIEMNKETWNKMVKDINKRIKKGDTVISGGAAWSDHLAVKLFLDGKISKLKLRLPADFNSKTNRFIGAFGTPGGTVNYYHKKFSDKIGEDTLSQIGEAIKKGADVSYEPASEGYTAMFNRNTKVADESEGVIAYSYGDDIYPDNNTGTRDTWDKVYSDYKMHVPISKLSDKPLKDTAYEVVMESLHGAKLPWKDIKKILLNSIEKRQLTEEEVASEIINAQRDLIKYAKEIAGSSYGGKITDEARAKGGINLKTVVKKEIDKALDPLLDYLKYDEKYKAETPQFIIDELFGKNSRKKRMINVDFPSDRGEAMENLGDLSSDKMSVKSKEELFGKGYDKNGDLKEFFDEKSLSQIQNELFDDLPNVLPSKTKARELEEIYGKDFLTSEIDYAGRIKRFFDGRPITAKEKEYHLAKQRYAGYTRVPDPELEELFGKNYYNNKDLKTFFKFSGDTNLSEAFVKAGGKEVKGIKMQREIEKQAKSEHPSKARAFNESLHEMFKAVFKGKTYSRKEKGGKWIVTKIDDKGYGSAPNFSETLEDMLKKEFDERQAKDVIEKKIQYAEGTGKKLSGKSIEEIYGKTKDKRFVDPLTEGIDYSKKNTTPHKDFAAAEVSIKDDDGTVQKNTGMRVVKNDDDYVQNISTLDNLMTGGLYSEATGKPYTARRAAGDARKIVQAFIGAYNKSNKLNNKLSLQSTAFNKIIDDVVNKNISMKTNKTKSINFEEKNIDSKTKIIGKVHEIASEKNSPLKSVRFQKFLNKAMEKRKLKNEIDDNIFKRYNKLKDKTIKTESDNNKLKKILSKVSGIKKADTKEKILVKDLKKLESNLKKLPKTKGKEKTAILKEVATFMAGLSNTSKYLPMILLTLYALKETTAQEA